MGLESVVESTNGRSLPLSCLVYLSVDSLLRLTFPCENENVNAFLFFDPLIRDYMF